MNNENMVSVVETQTPSSDGVSANEALGKITLAEWQSGIGPDDTSSAGEAQSTAPKAVAASNATPAVVTVLPTGTAQSKAAPKRYRFTEGGNGERLVDKHGDKIRYCAENNSWYRWTGKMWSAESREMPHIMHLAKDIVADIRACIDTLTDMEMIAAAKSLLKTTDSVHGLRGAVRYAMADPAVSIAYPQFDSDRYMLNCKNGTVDLRTGNLRPHDPKNYIPRMISVNYSAGAKCPVWENTIDEVFDGDCELVSFFQKAVGYSLSGDTKEKIFFFLHGPKGNNGKSLILGVLRDLLGEYAISVDPKMLLNRRSDSIPNDVARLAGTRFVVAEETPRGHEMNESLIKQITGGPGTKMVARFMRQEFFEFEPLCKLFIATNHRVAMSADAPMFNRIRVIPFNVSFLTPERMAAAQRIGRGKVRPVNDRLVQTLHAELPGILSWAVRGYVDYAANGLTAPQSVIDATDRYREDVDVVGRYLDERVQITAGHREQCRKLYNDYRSWCLSNDEKPVTQRQLTAELDEKGIGRTDSKSTGGYFFYDGVQLLPSP